MRKLTCMTVCIFLLLAMSVTAGATEEPVVTTCTHLVSSWQTADDSSHTGVCTLCGESQTASHSWDAPSGTEATCTVEGQKTYTCSGCAATKTETISAAGHSFGNWTSVDTANHKRICSVCSVEETAAHSQSRETITTAATCAVEGKRDLVCVCGEIVKKDDVIPKLAHTYGQWTADTASHSRICSGCNGTDTVSHTFDKVTVVKAATCKETGEMTKICSTCGYTSQPEAVAKLTTHTYDGVCDDTCNICEEKRDAGHTFSTAWSKNGMGHWHACTVCGEKEDESKHVPGPAATAEKEQLCLTCGYVMMPKKNHVHDYEKKWSMDETGHWYACTGCDEQKGFAKHDYDSPCDTACNICGYKNEAAHDYAYGSSSTEKNHQAVCTVCGEKKNAEPHVPGPEATETEPQLCTICGYVMVPVQEHTHDFGNRWLNNSQSHWQACKCGEQSIPEPHSWDEGVQEKGGRIRFTCTRCALERTEIQEKSSFPWWILFTILGIVLVGGTGALVFILKMPKETGKYAKK